MEAKITGKKRVKLSEIFYFGEKKDGQTKPMKHICQEKGLCVYPETVEQVENM